jgi:hypothetical protein
MKRRTSFMLHHARPLLYVRPRLWQLCREYMPIEPPCGKLRRSNHNIKVPNMSLPVEALELEVLRLPAAERERLLDRVIASLDAGKARDKA